MAKELILLAKRKYEELLASQPSANEDNQEDMKYSSDPPVDVSTQIGNGLFVEKNYNNYAGTPGVLEHPSPQMKNARERKKNVNWIPYTY